MFLSPSFLLLFALLICPPGLVFSALISGAVEPPRREAPVSNPTCKLPKDRGTTCTSPEANGTFAIKWYFDTDTLQCLAFGYRGCGGNANRFGSIFDCRTQCRLPMDYGGCSGQKPSAKDEHGQLIMCGAGPAVKTENPCPEGYRCQMLAFFGVCCHIETEEMYSRNHRPTCANGKQPHRLYDPVNKWHMVYLGKSCGDEFCPSDNTTCHQQEIFAHCCPK